MADGADESEEDSFKVLIGVTGSVASIKLKKLVEELLSSNSKIKVKVVATEHSTHFFCPDEIPVTVYRDEDEWKTWNKMLDPVLHIQLRHWADLLVLAPVDANTMGKIANGLCDNLLTCIVRAWDRAKPLLFCPAMNTHMWDHPLTMEHVSKLCSLQYIHVPPISKKLACGDTGVGAMAEVPTIVSEVLKYLNIGKSSINDRV